VAGWPEPAQRVTLSPSFAFLYEFTSVSSQHSQMNLLSGQTGTTGTTGSGGGGGFHELLQHIPLSLTFPFHRSNAMHPMIISY